MSPRVILRPYCGVPPSYSHKTQGTIFGRMRESSLCAVHKGIQDYLFEKLGSGDPTVLETFKKWTTVRDRTHWNMQNVRPRDPVTLGLCTLRDLNEAVDASRRRAARDDAAKKKGAALATVEEEPETVEQAIDPAEAEQPDSEDIRRD